MKYDILEPFKEYLYSQLPAEYGQDILHCSK